MCYVIYSLPTLPASSRENNMFILADYGKQYALLVIRNASDIVMATKDNGTPVVAISKIS